MPEPAPSSVKSKKRPRVKDSTDMVATAGFTLSTREDREGRVLRMAGGGRAGAAGWAAEASGPKGAVAVPTETSVISGSRSDEHAIANPRSKGIRKSPTEAGRLRFLPQLRNCHNTKPDTL